MKMPARFNGMKEREMTPGWWAKADHDRAVVLAAMNVRRLLVCQMVTLVGTSLGFLSFYAAAAADRVTGPLSLVLGLAAMGGALIGFPALLALIPLSGMSAMALRREASGTAAPVRSRAERLVHLALVLPGLSALGYALTMILPPFTYSAAAERVLGTIILTPLAVAVVLLTIAAVRFTQDHRPGVTG